MDNRFLVSARKYRPQSFDTVVGQAHITTTLKNAILNNQLAHAFLFCGPRGVGKTTCARILAKTINCENLQPDGEACNECTSCKNFNEGTSLNIHELDAASNNSVDDIRLLVEQVRFAPQAGKYKVYIVDEVHMLSSSAFNAFLKTLEEPPPYAIFILATTEKHKILPTILSRCQIFDFKRITVADMVSYLQKLATAEGIETETAALQLIAQKSEGCMRDALSLFDKIVSFTNKQVTYANTLEHLNILDEDYYFQLLQHITQQNLSATLLLFDEINKKGFEGDVVLNGFASFIRNILVCKDAASVPLLDTVEGMHEKYKTTAQTLSLPFLISALNVLNEAEINYKAARNKRLHIELTLIKLNFLQQAVNLATNTEKEIIRKKTSDYPIAYQTKPIAPLQIKKLNTLDKPVNKPANSISANNKNEQAQTQATLYIETNDALQPNFVQEPVLPNPNNKSHSKENAERKVPERNKKTLLESLKEQYGNLYHIQEIKEPEILNLEKLQRLWQEYITNLEKQQKHSLTQVCKQATLLVKNELTFVIEVQTLTHKKLIELEKSFLNDFIQQAFNNRSIHFEIKITDAPAETTPLHLTLTAEQTFQRMAEKYPLLYDLRKQLGLELD